MPAQTSSQEMGRPVGDRGSAEDISAWAASSMQNTSLALAILLVSSSCCLLLCKSTIYLCWIECSKNANCTIRADGVVLVGGGGQGQVQCAPPGASLADKGGA